jgi:hypothetical protein
MKYVCVFATFTVEEIILYSITVGSISTIKQTCAGSEAVLRAFAKKYS